MPRYRFTSRVTDSAARRTRDAAPADIGNRLYCLSLPAGEYEAEDDDEAGLMRLNRVDADHPRQFICALPAGAYSTETDDDGVVHLYREPDGEPVRTPIMEGTLDQSHRAATERASLRQINTGNANYWDRQKRPGGNAVISDINKHNAAFWSRQR